MILSCSLHCYLPLKYSGLKIFCQKYFRWYCIEQYKHKHIKNEQFSQKVCWILNLTFEFNKIYLHEIILPCLWLASASWSWLLIGRSWWHDLWWCEDVSNQFGLSQSISQRRLSPASASNITSYQAGMERNWGNISYKNSSILLEWIPSSSNAFEYYFRA